MALPLLLFLLLVLFLIQSSSSNDLVTRVCQFNDDPTFCAEILNSDSRTPGADLAGLGNISIDLGLVLATNITNLIILMNNSANDPGLKECFNECDIWYGFAKDYLLNASAALSTRSYTDMNMAAVSAGLSGLVCEEVFEYLLPRPSPIRVQNDNFYYLTQATVVISNVLQEGSNP